MRYSIISTGILSTPRSQGAPYALQTPSHGWLRAAEARDGRKAAHGWPSVLLHELLFGVCLIQIVSRLLVVNVDLDDGS